MANNHLNQRLNSFMKVVRIPGKTLSDEMIAEDLPASQSTISQWINSDVVFPAFVPEYLHRKYNMNLRWFFTGEGEMLGDGGRSDNEKELAFKLKYIEEEKEKLAARHLRLIVSVREYLAAKNITIEDEYLKNQLVI